MKTDIHLCLPDLEALQPGGFRYVMARDGLFVQRDTPLFTSTAKGRVNLPELDEMESGLTIKVPKVPVELLEQAVGFLRAVWYKHGGEGCLILLYNPKTKEYQWHCPVQTSDWCVKFTRPLDVPPGWIDIGDIHSHPNGIAYPSGVDTSDERSCDGIHIIAGKICDDVDHKRSEKHLHFHTDFCVDGERFKWDWAFTGVPQEFPEPPEEWMANVTKAVREPFFMGAGSASEDGVRSGHTSFPDWPDNDDPSDYYGRWMG